MYKSTLFQPQNQTISLPASAVWGEKTAVEAEIEAIMQEGNHPGDLALQATDEIAKLRAQVAQLQERLELSQSLLGIANLRQLDYRKTVEQIMAICHYHELYG